MASGPRVAVLGAPEWLGEALALGLEDHGASVARIAAADGTFGCDPSDRQSLGDALRRACESQPLDAFVHADLPTEVLEPEPLETTDEDAFDRRCDAVLRRALVALQAAFDVLDGRPDARIVVVVPTLALTGGAGLVPYASAAEGVRGLLRSAARQWGPRGITVNCLAPSIDALASNDAAPGRASARTALGDAALQTSGDVRRDLGATLAFLASPASHALTGATLRADGGTWMAG